MNIPQGYKLVPVEPTREMIRAAIDWASNASAVKFSESYCVMLAASPPAPTAQAAVPMQSTEPLCYAVSIEVASALANERTLLDACTKRHGAYDTPLYTALRVAQPAWTVTDELLVDLFYAAQSDITKFRIKARALLTAAHSSTLT